MGYRDPCPYVAEAALIRAAIAGADSVSTETFKYAAMTLRRAEGNRASDYVFRSAAVACLVDSVIVLHRSAPRRDSAGTLEPAERRFRDCVQSVAREYEFAFVGYVHELMGVSQYWWTGGTNDSYDGPLGYSDACMLDRVFSGEWA